MQTDSTTKAATASQWAEDLARQGKVDEALGALYDALRHDRLDPDLHARMHQLLLMKGDRMRILQHGSTYLKALTGAKRSAEALVALQVLEAMDFDFVAPSDCIVPMARAAHHARDYRTAARLLRGFDRSNPGHQDVPGALFLGARITSEFVQQHERAMKILEALLQRYPESKVKEAAVRYLASLRGRANARLADDGPILIA